MNAELSLKNALELLERSNIEMDTDNAVCIHEYLSTISDEDLISLIGMADMSLLVLLFKLKYQTNPQVIPIENDLMIRIDNCNLANFSYLALYLHFLDIQGNKLIVEGTTSFPAIFDNVKFGIRINGIDKVIPTYPDTSLDLKIGKNIYESRKRFYQEIDLKDNISISFFNSISGIAVEYGRINSMRFSPVADTIPNQYYYKDDYVVCIKGNKIHVRLINNDIRKKYENKFLESVESQNPSKIKWIKSLRKEFWEYQKQNKTKPVFLLMDRTNSANDNARVFWEYLLDKDDVEAYFVLSKAAKEYDEMRSKGKVIELYSEEHYRLALTADYIISSQCNGVVENPFWEDSEYFRDIYHRPKIIFLQHGVIKDDMSITLNRFNTNFCGFVTSTSDEWKSIIDYPYMYQKDKVWNVGLPRFDRLYDAKEKIILIMPTWRQGLMVQKWDETNNNMSWVIRDDLVNTEYYQRYSSLLNNKRLKKICKKYGYKIVFCPHPLIKPFFKCDKKDNFCETDLNCSYRELFAKGSLLISDYSSVVYDFLYLKKPVIYYQFDRESFFKEHTYKPGYFDYKKEMYGYVTDKENALVSLIEKYIKNDCKLSEKHSENIEILFDRNYSHCELLLNRIKENYFSTKYNGGMAVEKVDAKDLLIDDLNRENYELKQYVKQLTRERDDALYSLEETRKSFTYKIGRAITFLPRKIRR